jgi:hypothetical protein
MNWKAIGQSVIGTSHLQSKKECEDAIAYKIANNQGSEILICAASDGAGSAQFAREASAYVTATSIEIMSEWGAARQIIAEADILRLAEILFDGLSLLARSKNCHKSEFSCTFLGCYLEPNRSLFFQIGDGAIIRNDGNGDFTAVWWPQNGEYSNTTVFLIDDNGLASLRIIVLEEPVYEVALFTDGLQHLVLNTESQSVHQPFFDDLFKWVRRAESDTSLLALNKHLGAYLGSPTINIRTDDDKTLFLATRQ